MGVYAASRDRRAPKAKPSQNGTAAAEPPAEPPPALEACPDRVARPLRGPAVPDHVGHAAALKPPALPWES